MRRLTYALAAIAALAACQDTPTQPETSLTVEPNLGSAGPVVASATGSAQRVRNGRQVVHTFSARLRADGSADGSYHVDFQDLDPGPGQVRVRFDVDVTCMSVSGNRAWVAGIISNVNGPIVQEGTVSYFYVTDNGEGNGAVDEISGLRINDVAGEDLAFCTEQPTLLVSVPIEMGNAQVKVN